MSERPNHVVLTEFFANACRDLIYIDEMRIFVLFDFRCQVHIELLDKIHYVLQVVARLKPSQLVLLRTKKSENECQQLAVDV